MRVKICGLKTEEAVSASVSAGADYLGFIFFEKSPRHLVPEQAAAISKNIPAKVKKVAVVVNPENALLQQIYEKLKPDYFQLHGDESSTRTVAIRETFRTPIIKAIGISQKDDLHKAEAFKDVAEYLLFDAKPPKDSQLKGGLGKTFDWNLLTAPASLTSSAMSLTPSATKEGGLLAATRHSPHTTPFFLSGGLTPENITEAIRLTSPFGVDVSSGVEASPGVKDLQKIRRFIENVRKEKI